MSIRTESSRQDLIKNKIQANLFNGGRALNAIFSSDLKSAQKIILLFLGSKADFRGDFMEFMQVSQKEIAKNCSLSRRTVITHLLELENNKYVETVGKKAEENFYCLTFKIFSEYEKALKNKYRKMYGCEKFSQGGVKNFHTNIPLSSPKKINYCEKDDDSAKLNGSSVIPKDDSPNEMVDSQESKKQESQDENLVLDRRMPEIEKEELKKPIRSSRKRIQLPERLEKLKIPSNTPIAVQKTQLINRRIRNFFWIDYQDAKFQSKTLSKMLRQYGYPFLDLMFSHLGEYNQKKYLKIGKSGNGVQMNFTELLMSDQMQAWYEQPEQKDLQDYFEKKGIKVDLCYAAI